MPNVISNTSCLVVLDNAKLIHILKRLYENIFITEEVYKEFGKDVESWIQVGKVENWNYVKLLGNSVDLGEATTIALAIEMKDSLLILDDLKARKIAKSLDLTFTGTMGVLLKAKEKGIISSIRDTLEQIKSCGFHLSEKNINLLLNLAKEK